MEWIETFGPFYADGDNNDEKIYNALFDTSPIAVKFREDNNINTEIIDVINTPNSINCR